MKKISGMIGVVLLLAGIVSCSKSPSTSIIGPVSTPISTPIGPITSSPATSSAGGKDDNIKFTVYSVNDTHGSIESNPEAQIAGLAKIKTAITSDSDYDPASSVILSAGDMFQGTAISNINKGELMVDVMNEFPFDAMTVGNHEFDWGLEPTLNKLVEKAAFPFLGANISRKDLKPIPSIKNSVLLEKGGYKIGVVGSIEHGIDSSILYTNVKDYLIADDYNIVLKEGEKLRKEGADYVLFLTHQGYTNNAIMLANSAVFDAVLLGHEHTVVDHYEMIGSRKIPVLMAGANGQQYSKIVFYEDGTNSQSVNFISNEMSETLEVDPTIQALIDKTKKENDAILSEVLFTTDGYFSRYQNSAFPTNGSLGTLITKSLYEYAVSKGLTNVIAFHNKAGVRADFPCYSNVCDFTYENLYQISPFDNQVHYIIKKGNEIPSSLYNHFYYGYDPLTNKLADGSTVTNDTVLNFVTIEYLTANPDFPDFYSPTPLLPGDEAVDIREALLTVFRPLDKVSVNDYPFGKTV